MTRIFKASFPSSVKSRGELLAGRPLQGDAFFDLFSTARLQSALRHLRLLHRENWSTDMKDMTAMLIATIAAAIVTGLIALPVTMQGTVFVQSQAHGEAVTDTAPYSPPEILAG